MHGLVWLRNSKTERELAPKASRIPPDSQFSLFFCRRAHYHHYLVTINKLIEAFQKDLK